MLAARLSDRGDNAVMQSTIDRRGVTVESDEPVVEDNVATIPLESPSGITLDIRQHRRLALWWEFIFGPVPELAAAALIREGYADE